MWDLSHQEHKRLSEVLPERPHRAIYRWGQSAIDGAYCLYRRAADGAWDRMELDGETITPDKLMGGAA